MQNARPLCKKVQPMPVTIFRASVWANVLEEGQETSQITTQIGQENSQITTQIGQENGKEGQEKGKKRAKTIRQQIKNCCLIVHG